MGAGGGYSFIVLPLDQTVPRMWTPNSLLSKQLPVAVFWRSCSPMYWGHHLYQPAMAQKHFPIKPSPP